MKNALALALVALVVSLVALVGMLLGSRAEVDPQTGSVMPVERADAEVLARLDELVSELRGLRNRVDMLEAAPVRSSRAPAEEAVASKEEFDALKEEVRSVIQDQDGLPVRSEVFQEQVAETLQKLQEEAADEKERLQYERRTSQVGNAVEKLDTRLDLTPAQANSMEVALLARYERQAELSQLWNQGGDLEVVGELKLADAVAFEAELASFLTIEQLELFQSEQTTGK